MLLNNYHLHCLATSLCVCVCVRVSGCSNIAFNELLIQQSNYWNPTLLFRLNYTSVLQIIEPERIKSDFNWVYQSHVMHVNVGSTYWLIHWQRVKGQRSKGQMWEFWRCKGQSRRSRVKYQISNVTHVNVGLYVNEWLCFVHEIKWFEICANDRLRVVV